MVHRGRGQSLRAAGQAQFTAYLYGLRLSSAPGTAYVYSSDGYYLLARVIEKAVGENYLDWVDANVLAPVGVTDAVVSATAQGERRPNEVPYDDPNTGRSVLAPQQDVTLPDAYGGLTVFEDLDGASVDRHLRPVPGEVRRNLQRLRLGAHQRGYWRDGTLAGTRSWMESLGDGVDFAFIFNTRVDRSGAKFDVVPLRNSLAASL